MARAQMDSARRIAADVARRAKAGDLARADQHQADGAVAAAEAGVAQLEADATATLEQLKALTGGIAPASPVGLSPTEPEPVSRPPDPHPALSELQDRVTVAERAAASVDASIRSITASACARSILSLRKARSVNSPG